MTPKADETDSYKLLVPPSPTRPTTSKLQKVTFQRSLSESCRESQDLPDIDDIDDVITEQTALSAPPTTAPAGSQPVKSWGLPFQRSQPRGGVSEDSDVSTATLPGSPPARSTSPTPIKWTLPFPYALTMRQKAVPVETTPIATPPWAASTDCTASVKRSKSLDRRTASADM